MSVSVPLEEVLCGSADSQMRGEAFEGHQAVPNASHRRVRMQMPDSANHTKQSDYKSFTTAHIPHHERLEYWEAHNAEALIGLDIRPLHAQTLEAQQRNRESSTTRAAKVLGSSQLIERSEEMIRKYPTESVALFFCTQGDSFYSDVHGTHLLHAGQMLICDADKPFIRGFGVGVSEMVLTVTMNEFTKVSGGKPLENAQKFTFGSPRDQQPRIAAATRLAQWIDDALGSTDQPGEISEDDCLSWLEVLFQGSGNDSTQLFEKAQHFIDVHLSSPDLRRTDVAGFLHMSERHIARLFAANDTSFSRELLMKRIDAAKFLLSAEPHTSIAEISRRCGFRSTPHFSRTFRELVGHSPTEARINVTRH